MATPLADPDLARAIAASLAERGGAAEPPNALETLNQHCSHNAHGGGPAPIGGELTGGILEGGLGGERGPLHGLILSF